MDIRHTFLLQAGKWRAEGTFYDAEANAMPISGSAIITHEGGIWYNRALMTIHTDTATDIECVYEIVPISKGADHTTWVAETLPLGRIKGTFTVVGDTILSAAQTDQGTNVESLRKVDDNTYSNCGALCINGIKLSSWFVTLTREEG